MGSIRLRFLDRHDIVMGVVERGTDQIVHAGVENEEMFAFALLGVDHARHQHPGIGGDHPSRLEDQPHVDVLRQSGDHGAVGDRFRRRRVVGTVRHCQSAAQIEARDGVSVAAQLADELDQARERRLEGGKLRDLAADMDVDADDLDILQLRRQAIDFARPAPGNAEFGLGVSGGDFRMRLGVDVGIETQRDGRVLA